MKTNCSKLAVVIGGADCWREDWDSFLKTIPKNIPFDVAVVNDQISTFDLAPISWMFTLHPEKLEKWLSARIKQTNVNIVIQDKPKVVLDGINIFDRINDTNSCKGCSSGGYAAYNLLKYYGYQAVVLIGVPMNGQKNTFRDETGWSQYKSYLKAWEDINNKNLFRFRLRSMSGFTKELYGCPDEDWYKLILKGK